MWGIIPAAGAGSRIQPLAFSKELLPVGSRFENGVERPRTVSEYIIERMIIAGVTKICIVISPGKSDIMEYYGGGDAHVHFYYVVQSQARGLCDAIFAAAELPGSDESVIIGLPDTIWFPQEALCSLPDSGLSFLLFPVAKPELFDAVLTDHNGAVLGIKVKQKTPPTNWVWGAFKMPGIVLNDLFKLWQTRNRRDEYIGTLINAYLENGGIATAVQAGEDYVDVGTLNGYRQAILLLAGKKTVLKGMNV